MTSKQKPAEALMPVFISDLDRDRLLHAVAIACQSYGPWPAGFSDHSDGPHFSVDQIITVLEAPRLPVGRPARLPHRTREDLRVLRWSETKNIELVDHKTLFQFEPMETTAALAGVRIAWLFRDFVALGLRSDGPKRGITELLHEKENLHRLVALICRWTSALETQILQDAWLTTGATFNNKSGLEALDAFRLTTQQVLRALASSRKMLKAELRWQRDLDDRLNGSARANFIHHSVAPCFKEIYGHSSLGNTKGIWRSHDAAATQRSVKIAPTGPLIRFAVEVFQIVGSDTSPETIDDALGRRVREKKGRVRAEPARIKRRALKPSTILSTLRTRLAEPAGRSAWSNWHSIFGPQSQLGTLDAYTATLDRLAQDKKLQHVPRK